MANFYDDNEDLKYYVDRGVDWKALYEATEFGKEKGFADVDEAVGFYKDLLSLLGEFAANEVAPRAAKLDRGHMTLDESGEVAVPQELKEIEEKAREIELHTLPLPREFGGMNAPLLLYLLNGELLSRGDVSVMTHFGFHAGIAMAALIYSVHEGSAELDLENGTILDTPYRKAIEEIAQGKAWGSMDITEPHAGSDMGELRSKGEQDAKGNWYVTGQKIFITSGHGKYHFVIARTEDPKEKPGLEGLSLFLVEAYEEDKNGKRKRDTVTMGRVEEKIGHHGSPTCLVNYEKAPAKLVGKRGEGFRLMLLLMNNARISVGFESLGLCEAAYRMSKAYAEERPSMGKMIVHHEMVADMLDEMYTDIQAIRALAVTCAVNEELAQRTKILRLLHPEGSEERKRLDKIARDRTQQSRMYTPLLKAFASEKAVEMGRKAMQIHGGVGYTTEYGAEKLLRDALVLPIYEGTTQIQALMAMKDNLLGVMKDPKGFAANYAKAVRDAVTERDERRRGVAVLRKRTYDAIRHLMTKIFGAKVKKTVGRSFAEWKTEFKDWDPKKDFGPAMLHAERLLKLLTDLAIAEILLEQAERHEDRAEVFERWMERALPRSRQMIYEITTTGDRLLAKLKAETPEDADAGKASKGEPVAV